MKELPNKSRPEKGLARSAPRLLAGLVLLCLVFCWLPACGGGEDGPASADGTASGRLLVPPNHVLEEEPNQTIAQAQRVEESWLVTAGASKADPGYSLPGFPSVKVEDLYRVSASERTQVALTIAEDNLYVNDLDLLLMDSGGGLIDASEGTVSTEVIDTPGPGEFIVGVRAFRGSSAYALSFTSLGALPAGPEALLPASADFVPGELLVRLRAGNRAAAAGIDALASRTGLVRKRSLPGGVELLRVPRPSPAPGDESTQEKLLPRKVALSTLKAMTLDRIRRLREMPEIEYAEPNFLRRPFVSPEDPGFDLQWHYRLINLPEAWDAATGSDEFTVAVLDSGVLSGHPDLGARLTDGYDFVSQAANANDGDGRDPDPEDPGDDPEGQSSSFHGTHVAGTVGAVTNNSLGVAGVTWNTRIMPLRVLGVDGGADADIAQAIRYAARLTNASGRLPARAADIVNLSFGGFGFSQTLQDAVSDARAEGLILVAAAGNEGTRLATYPAALEGVISVSAVDINLQKAGYSSFGPTIDVAAPGGDMSVDLNGDGFGDGILSTLGNDRGEHFYRFYQGTSMAAPHVAGVLALMLAANPDLTPTDIDRLLAGTHPDTTVRITHDLGPAGRDDLFGNGLIDAAQAVLAAQSIPGGAGVTPSGSILAVSTSVLNFDNFLDQLSFKVTNAGIGTLRVSRVTEDASWLTLTPLSGTAPLAVRASVDRTGLADGEHTATIWVSSDATQGTQDTSIRVEMRVGGRTLGDVGRVFVLVLDPASSDTVAEAETDARRGYLFTTTPVAPGKYQIIAGTDLDNDGFICDIEDACGFAAEPVAIRPGQEASAIDFVVSTIASPQAAGGGSGSPGRERFQRLR
jgi:serine protease